MLKRGHVSWDVAIFHAVNSLAGQSAIADWVMLMLARPSSLVVPGALVLVYWVWVSRREAFIGATVLAGLILLTDLFGAQIKHAIGRVRPCQILEGVNQLVGCGGTFSFPSNHALNTAAAAAFAHALYPATGWVTWPLVALVGFSRVYLGGHYVTDVLGGWAIGGALGLAAAFLLLRWPTFRSRSATPSRGDGEL